jgi:hypothetical protein
MHQNVSKTSKLLAPGRIDLEAEIEWKAKFNVLPP